MLENIIPLTRKPDILDCLANLSSDEVFTPPDIANKVLDMLPQEVWSNPKLKFLDPCAKSGVFLREIAKRLMTGLEAVIPDEEQRRDHVFKNMVYGIAITELTALISRRSLYYSKDATNEHSVVEMDDEDGNIHYQRAEHTYKAGKCIHCGVNEGSLDRGDERENYAYAFIHRPLKEIFNMKFDVIIGNPPYQLNVGVEKENYAIPIYHKFIQMAKELNPRYLSFIVPARWYAGGRGLDAFRDEMLTDTRISTLVDFPNANDCFPGVDISGGVCYFLWDNSYSGDCVVRQMKGGQMVSEMRRELKEEGSESFVRFNEAISIIRKVSEKGEASFSKLVSAQTPYGFHSTFTDYKNENFNGALLLHTSSGEKYINREQVVKGNNIIDTYKVFISKSYGERGEYPYLFLGKPFAGAPGEVCTQTYLSIGPLKSQQEVDSVISYMRSKFFRFLVGMKKNTQDAMRGVYAFAPMQTWDTAYTDEFLYEKYGLSKGEIDFIEGMVREMA